MPAFLRAIEQAKREVKKIYILDENFVNSIRVLTSADEGQRNKSAADLKKQWLGFLLLSKTFDPKISSIEDSLFAKSVNTLLNAISNTINKHDIFSDISVVAVRAFQSLLSMLSELYDQKLHSAALLILKQISQVIIRKLEKEISHAKSSGMKPEVQYFASKNLNTPFRIVLKTLLTCLELFPGSFK